MKPIVFILIQFEIRSMFLFELQVNEPVSFRINLIDLFDEVNSNKSLTDCIKTTDEKNLILIESLPWLFLRMNQGDLFRLLFNWSRTRFFSFNLKQNKRQKVNNSFRNKCCYGYDTFGLSRRSFDFERFSFNFVYNRSSENTSEYG